VWNGPEKSFIGELKVSGTVIFSDESQVVVGNNNRIYIWRKKDAAESRDCVSPPAQRRLSVMIWECISHYGVGTITTVNGTIEHICTFFVTFFSATIDGRDLIFGRKLHIGTPYRGKHFWTHQIPT
jgi:hypothetical protein